jgi:hypothetical protein
MTMPRYLPTIRGWLAFLLSVLACCAYPMLLPAYCISSLGPTSLLAEPVSPSARVLGGLLAFLCVATCVEAFRRGSRADRVVACIAMLLTISFITGFCHALSLPTQPNKSVQRMSAAGVGDASDVLGALIADLRRSDAAASSWAAVPV